MWTTIEATTAIICACLPMVRATLSRFFPNLFPSFDYRKYAKQFVKNNNNGAPNNGAPNNGAPNDEAAKEEAGKEEADKKKAINEEAVNNDSVNNGSVNNDGSTALSRQSSRTAVNPIEVQDLTSRPVPAMTDMLIRVARP